MVKERWQLKNKKLPKESDHEETFQGQIEDGIKIGEKWTRIGDGIKIGETFQGQIVEAWMLVEGPWAHSGPKQRNPLWKKCCEATQLVRGAPVGAGVTGTVIVAGLRPTPFTSQLQGVQPEQPMQASLIPSLSLPQAKPVVPVLWKKSKPPVPESWRVSKSMEELKKLSHKADL
jgi:hypothetical protein